MLQNFLEHRFDLLRREVGLDGTKFFVKTVVDLNFELNFDHFEVCALPFGGTALIVPTMKSLNFYM